MILHSKNFAMIFISINISYSFYVADHLRLGTVFVQHRKMHKFCRTLHNRQLIQFARIPFEFVVRFIRYQNRVQVITQHFVYCRRYKGFANNFSITFKQDEQGRF